ncbi:MAG: hypothetical protein JWO82_733 [Akkermansiaceae bacterium]|nr:hypothetical protein [Akkermansiaceae bacterium]
MFTRSLLLTGFAVLPLLPGSASAAEPSRSIVGKLTMALEWKGLSALRTRVYFDWSTVDSTTRILKLGPKPEIEKDLEKGKTDLAEAKATLAARSKQMEAKLGAEELRFFREEQKQEAALVTMLQTLEGMKKDGHAADNEAIDLGARAYVLGESLKLLRAAISPSLSGVAIPEDVKPSHR